MKRTLHLQPASDHTLAHRGWIGFFSVLSVLFIAAAFSLGYISLSHRENMLEFLGFVLACGVCAVGAMTFGQKALELFRS